MVTVLHCSDYKCTRTNVNAFRDTRTWAEKQADKPKAKAGLNTILCTIHTAGLKRSKYRDDPLPLTEKDKARLLKEQAVLDEEHREEARLAHIAYDEREAKRHAAEWAELNLTGGYRIVANDDHDLFDEEPTYDGKVWIGDEPQDRYDSRWFNIEPSQRNYGRTKEGEREWPYIIRVTRGANLTPNEARALATALVDAAGRAEKLNEKRKPS